MQLPNTVKVLYSGNRPAKRTQLGYIPHPEKEIGIHTFRRQDKLRSRILARAHKGGVRNKDIKLFYLTGNPTLRVLLKAQNRNPKVFYKMADKNKAIRMNKNFDALQEFFARSWR